MSAGLGNVILQTLNKHDLITDNVKVIANHLDYKRSIDTFLNENVQQHQQLVHPYNKDDVSLYLTNSYFQKFSRCKNVILLGDSLGDIQMSCGVVSPETVLSIGFLNDQVI